MWAFAFVLFIFLSPSSGFASVPDALYSTFLMGILGDDSAWGTLEDSLWPEFAKFVFLLLMFCVLVVMLNLLISLMGSSYEKVMDMFVVTQRNERAKVCVQQLGLLSALAPGYLRW